MSHNGSWNPLKHPKAPLISGSLTITVLVGYFALHRASPGDLSRDHAEVAGSSFLTDCNKCHGGKPMASQCLKCHEEMQAQLASQRGYHAYLLKGKELECAHCHSEHNGTDFHLINPISWQQQDLKKFRHEHAQFRLDGKHIGLACEKCHQDKLQKKFFLPKFKATPRQETYLGLAQACMGCHKDVHAGGLAANCEKCHDQNAWKPSPTRLFNHEKFFSLKGVHAKPSCAKCHILAKRGIAAPLAKNFPFERANGKRCADCHKNPHRANWRASCETCHAVSVPWSAATAKMSAAPKMARELHAFTAFPLVPPHDKASCRKCHDPKLSFALSYPNPTLPDYRRRKNNCETCHRDVHGGQFTPRHPRCADCHSPRAFKPAKFGVRDHSIYPLTGGHAAAQCNACHVKSQTAGVRIYKDAPRACAACHRDVHAGQFRRDGSTRCEECHVDSKSWKKIVFNHDAQSRFKLDSAHRNVACKECHPTVALPNQKRIIQYKPLRMECRDCHDFR